MLKNLTDKRWQLSEAIDEAEDNLITYQNDYQNDAELIDRINNELNRLQLINGTADKLLKIRTPNTNTAAIYKSTLS